MRYVKNFDVLKHKDIDDVNNLLLLYSAVIKKEFENRDVKYV